MISKFRCLCFVIIISLREISLLLGLESVFLLVNADNLMNSGVLFCEKYSIILVYYLEAYSIYT